MSHQDTSELPEPCGVLATPASDDGWSVLIQWDYGYRFGEISHFTVERKKHRNGTWEEVATNIPRTERLHLDTLPDNETHLYRVSAVTEDGRKLISGASNLLAADRRTSRPSGLRKPLASTQRTMFLCWDPHPRASAYALDVLDEADEPYQRVMVPDPRTPLGLLTDVPATSRLTVRLHVMRRKPDGSLWEASHADGTFDRDDAKFPHLGLVDCTTESDDLTRGIVVGLAEGKRPPPVAVDGVIHDAWDGYEGHWSLAIQYLTTTGITASLRTTP